MCLGILCAPGNLHQLSLPNTQSFTTFYLETLNTNLIVHFTVVSISHHKKSWTGKILYDFSYIVKFIETKRSGGHQELREWGVRWCLMDRVLVLQDEKSIGDWLYSNVNVLNTTELYTLKNG